MQDVSAAWLSAAQADNPQPVIVVELLACGLAYATRAVPGAHVWRVDDGAYVDQTILVDSTRGPFATTLAPFDEALGRLTASLDDRTNSARVSGTTVTLLNAERLSTIMDTVTLDNTPIQISLGFASLAPHHNVILLRGVVDDVEWDRDRLTLVVTDDALRVQRDLSTVIGSRYFPSTPRPARGRAIPIGIGRQTNIEAIPVQGDATGTLGLTLADTDTDLYLREFDAPFPDAGTLSVGTETGLTYTARLAVVLGGITYLRLSGLTRGAPETHAALSQVTLTGHTYQYLVAYELGAVSAVRAADALVAPEDYTVTADASGADRPVTLLTFPTQPQEPVTVDAEGLSVALEGGPTNGGFETGDLTGWTLSGGATLDVTSGDAASSLSTYKGELTGSEESWEEAYTEFGTVPERFYTLELAYRDTLVDSLVSNGDFTDGLSDWTINDALVNNSTLSTEQGAALIRVLDHTTSFFFGAFFQDVTTTIGETYTFQFRFKGYALTGGVGSHPAFSSYTLAGWRVGTAADDTLYAEQSALTAPLYDRNRLPTWHSSPPVSFVATTTSTRLTIEAYGTGLGYSLFPLAVTDVQLTQSSAPPTSTSAYRLGTSADPSAYQDTTLPQSYTWTTTQHIFQALTATTRLTLRSQWSQLSTPSHVDSARLLDAGRNPADAIAYVIDTYVPDMARNLASFTDAYTRLRGWQFGAYLPDPGEAQALVARMADQCKSVVVRDADGAVSLIVDDTDRDPVLTLTPATIREDSFSAHRETLDNLYSEVFVYYGLRDGQSRTSPDSYQGVTYAQPEGTTHPEEALDALCAGAHNLYRRTRRLDVFADMIRDLDTANKLLAYKVRRHTVRHDDVTLTTSLAAAPVQVADLVHVIHPWLHAGQPQLCQVRARAVRGVDVTLTLRTIQQAGLYEDWEPPALATFDVALYETWEPDAADLFGPPVDPGVWLIADDLTGTLSDADPVAAWPERVSGASVTQGSAGLQPTYRAGVLNGHAVVRFDGADDWLDGGSRLDAIAGDAGYTFVVVCTNVAASTGSPFGYGCFFARDASGDRGMSFNYHNGTKFLRAYVPTSPSVTPTLRIASNQLFTSAHILGARYDGTGTTLQTFFDGADDSGTLTGTIPATIGNAGPALRIGNDGWGDVLKGDIAELIYYRRALTDDELLSLHNYLSDKYGV